MVFSIFRLVQTAPEPILEFFHLTWKRNPVSSPPPYPVSANQFSVFLNLPILDISDTWNHTKYDPLWLASFSLHVFRIHPCCSMYRHFFLSCNGYVAFCLSIHQLMDVWVVFTFDQYEWYCCEQLCIHVCAHMFCFSGIYLEVKLLSHTISNSMLNFLSNRQTIFQSCH